MTSALICCFFFDGGKSETQIKKKRFGLFVVNFLNLIEILIKITQYFTN